MIEQKKEKEVFLVKAFVPEKFFKLVRETDDAELRAAVELTGFAVRFSAEDTGISLKEFIRFLSFLESEPGEGRHSREELLFFARNAGLMAEILSGSEKGAESIFGLRDRAKRCRGMKKRRIL